MFKTNLFAGICAKGFRRTPKILRSCSAYLSVGEEVQKNDYVSAEINGCLFGLWRFWEVLAAVNK